MSEPANIAIAVVGVSAILPDAPDADAFWKNLLTGRYSISDVDASRWDPADYYDPDPSVPDKTYSKIGGWVRDWKWDPMGWRLPIPPRVAEAMDDIQKWAIYLARAALLDYGWPSRPLDVERTGVIVGNALAGENQWVTMQRVAYPEYAHDLARAESFASLPASTQTAILAEARAAVAQSHREITEDTMPGELANVIAGRVANVFDLRGPNYVCDAACASALAAMNAAVGELVDGHCDAVITGGVDRTMNATAFVKFCKIGALSATGTRPYAEGADGFVMGEGGAFFLLKRLADAERDGDRIYAVVRGLGGSSDGKGKGITAPNPAGQRLAIERAWKTAGLSPATATLIEGHGTSTRVGDAVEVESLSRVLGAAGAERGAVLLGSVKSNIGHLKAAAGAAGLLKTVLALHHKAIPPSLHCERPSPDLDFDHSPLRVVTELREWPQPAAGVRRAGVSAFGFGGTNFHAVLEEHIPGRLDQRRTFAVAQARGEKAPLRGVAVLGAATARDLASRLDALSQDALAGRVPAREAPANSHLQAQERIAIDFGDAKELAEKCGLALRALALEPAQEAAATWKALRARGIFRGAGSASKVAFLYTGQGSQYANMLGVLRRSDPVVGATFAEADAIMRPLLGRGLSDILFVDPQDPAAVTGAEAALRETEVTQPAVMTVDLALTRLLESYGVRPDMVIGHSLGEYGALMVAGSLTFEHTLEAVSARGREMSQLKVDDRGLMVAAIAPLAEIEKAVTAIGGGVVVANVNSSSQAVFGGPTAGVRKVMEVLTAAGYQVVELPVSHAFHTAIVAPAIDPLKRALVRLELRPPQLPVVSNVTGRFYPMDEAALPEMLELLGRQVAEPVQFVAGLHTLYDAGARVFVEVGPKRALQGFAEDVLGNHSDVLTLFTNHPKTGELESFNQALCGLYAAGLGAGRDVRAPQQEIAAQRPAHVEPVHEPVVITGAALGLPGTERVFDDGNLARILAGEVFIDVLPTRFRRAMLDKHITRLVKRDGADPSFETIEDPDDVIRLAARAGKLDVASDFGVPEELVQALDRTTQLAIGAGIDAMRDAGIPLVMRYHTTKSGTRLPERWALPDSMRDDTGVICSSAMPGLDRMVSTVVEWERFRARERELADLEGLRADFPEKDGRGVVELDRRIADLRREGERHPYVFDRRFLFRVLSMGHSQFAQLIGARGPNTQINAACASTTQAISLAQDWIRAGRCRRVLVVAGDDATSDNLMEWVGAGFLASGAAATDDVVENAAIPFDRRRHGMLIGMGAAALVVESAAAARERGLTPICEVLSTVTANSAFHGTRLDSAHISQVMEELVQQAERGSGIRRTDIAAQTVFVSHETYTPARGGSAAAEIDSLRAVFGDAAGKLVIANTKGFTGHPMGVGIEDVVAVKALETGIVPPVPNFRERDPDLGALNLSRGGAYDPVYALRLAAGFGSQISMALLRRSEAADRARPRPEDLGYSRRISDRVRWDSWLREVAGRPDPELEVVARTLRVREPAPTAPVPAPVAPPKLSTLTPPPAPASSDGRDPIADRVLSLVAEKTGYPADMLGLDLDLEADLGIDTVKQAELFAALRETYGYARDEKLQLRDFPTLAHVIHFVHEHTDGAAPAPTPPSVPPAVSDPIADRVLSLVAEKTGYPADMLGLDLDLEADLGIDTVKQAELFAALRETYGYARDEKLQLRDFPTLAHVIHFVHEHTDGATPTRTSTPTTTPTAPADTAAADAFPRRVPVPVLRPPAELCAPTGVSLDRDAVVVIVPDAGGAGHALAGKLRDRGVEVRIVACDAIEDESAISRPVDGTLRGVYWLPALDIEPDWRQMDLKTWRDGLRRRVGSLHALMRTLGGSPGKRGTFFISATAMGGRHGYGEGAATAPMGGAVAGFTKAFQRERPEALVKVVDFELARGPGAISEELIEETLFDPAVVEVGRSGEERWTVGLEARPADESGPTIGRDTVFLVTGAAGGIVSAIVADLAAASPATFHLLDLTPEPDPADRDIALFSDDREALKGELANRIRATGEKPTPAMIERRLASVERSHAAMAAIQAVRKAGGQCHYHSLDITDPVAVAAVMDDVRTRHGRVDVLIHAAGIEISHLLPDKDAAEFGRVFGVKADGWFNLLQAAGDMPLGAVVAFSSVAGRFGNAGQTDYSAANDLLCKSVSNLRSARPQTRAVAIDWTAWANIGMATRGSIRRVMELAGIQMLPPAAGMATVRRELASSTRGEVVVAGRLGSLLDEHDPAGGLDPSSGRWNARAPLVGQVVSMVPGEPLRAESRFDPREQPFLDHHRIDGTAVLPGVMGIEMLAETAALPLPGRRVVAIENVEFAAPLKFYRDEPRHLRFEASFAEQGSDVVARCRLVGSRMLTSQAEPQVTTHFTADVRLARCRAGKGSEALAVPSVSTSAVTAADIRKVYFHGPSFQVLEAAWIDRGRAVGRWTEGLPDAHVPATGRLLVAPRLIELCFQTVGAWELGTEGRLGLPARFASVVLYDIESGAAPLFAVVTPGNGSFDADVIDSQGQVLLSLRGYETVTLPAAIDEVLLAPFRAAIGRRP